MKRLAAIVLLLAAAACGSPVPPEKAAYVGEWQHPTMYLLITQDGSVVYQRIKGGSRVSVDAPLKEFQGNNIVAGVGPMTTTFVVSKPPFQDGNKWKMVVDDVELTRTSQ